MADQGITMSSLAKQMEIATGNDFQKVLKNLSSSRYVDEKLLKTDLGLLNAKILKLLRSNREYDVWKGCHAATVICSFNALFLLSYGGQSLNAIYSKLEHMVNYYPSTTNSNQGRTLLKTLVCTTKTLMDLMRNKPTLSRECLVPKLKAIIPTLIQLSTYEPVLCLPVLKSLLFKHTTTFKPYVNKYRTSLTAQIASSYHHMPSDVQKLLCDNYAYLHLIKLQSQHVQDETEAHHKVFQDDTWRAGIFSILIQFKPIIKLCNNILEFDQEKELNRLFESLPSDPYKDYKIENFLSPLKLDMNEPFTLWELPRRINLLVDLLTAFVTQPTPFPIRVPIGTINLVCETLVSISTKYMPIKRELRRDQDLNSIIDEILPEIQFAGISLWRDMLLSYGKCFLPMSDRILGSLEVFIPFKPKSNNIDLDACQHLQDKFITVFEVANLVLSNVGHRLNEVDSILKLVDVALRLTEDVSLIETIFENKPIDKKDTNPQTKNKSKKNKDNKTGAITDLFTNYDQFITKTSLHKFNELNNFLTFIISNWRLGTTQQINTVKYAIARSLQIKEQMGSIPISFIKLLRVLVLNPGNERLSILPIAVSLLKGTDDEAFDLLCHPRLPMSMIHNVKRVSKSSEEEDDEREEQEEYDVDMSKDGIETHDIVADHANGRFNVLNTTVVEETTTEVETNNDIEANTIENETKVFKKRSVEETEDDEPVKRVKTGEPKSTEEFIKEQEIADKKAEIELQPAVERVATEAAKDATVAKEEEEDSEDEDEFEIPEIHLSEYEDDEDAESDS